MTQLNDFPLLIAVNLKIQIQNTLIFERINSYITVKFTVGGGVEEEEETKLKKVYFSPPIGE